MSLRTNSNYQTSLQSHDVHDSAGVSPSATGGPGSTGVGAILGLAGERNGKSHDSQDVTWGVGWPPGLDIGATWGTGFEPGAGTSASSCFCLRLLRWVTIRHADFTDPPFAFGVGTPPRAPS
jgi:hypothetical protein